MQSLLLASTTTTVICNSVAEVVSMVRLMAATQERGARFEGMCQRLREAHTSRAAAIQVLSSIPDVELHGPDLSLLLDTFGSIVNIAHVTAEEIVDRTPCTQQTAVAVSDFFADPVEVDIKQEQEDLDQIMQ